MTADPSGFTPRSERGRLTRAKLLAAAEESFGTHGYGGASVADIVLRAGVSQGSFYVYFPGKEAIFRQLIRDMVREIRLVTREAASVKSSRSEAEVAGALAFFDWLRAHRHLHRILHQIDQVDESLAREFYDSISVGYVHGLDKSMADGEIESVDPELLAYALMGISHFVSMRWVLWEDDGFPDHLADDLRRIITHALGTTRPTDANQSRPVRAAEEAP